jgi:DNA polymerase elongation subunit (family B)
MSKRIKLEELRCIHRHTIEEHPSCFYKGLIKYEFKNDREWERVTGIPWYQYPGYKMGYFDIETDSLFADFGTVLSWCFKLKGGETKKSVITKKEIFNGDYDRRLIKEFIDELKNYKIIIGYNSTNFDLPYMRAKALHYGMDFPGYGENYHWDLYYTVKSKLRLSRKSLDNACDYLNIKGKTPIDKDIWRRAKYGDAKALDKVVEHNIGDVNILEELHDKLGFTRKWIRRSI